MELVRWSEPDQKGWKPGSTGKRGHWMRLFCCAMLLRLSAEPVNFSRFLSEDANVIQLISSAIKLGNKTTSACLQFLSKRMQAEEQYDEYDEESWPCLALGILVLFIIEEKDGQCAFDFLIEQILLGGEDLQAIISDSMCTNSWKHALKGVSISSACLEKLIRKSEHKGIVEALSELGFDVLILNRVSFKKKSLQKVSLRASR